MPKTLRLHHTEMFDLVRPEDLDGREALGEYTVLGRDGEETRNKVLVEGAFTDVELPDDYAGTPMELVHLVQTLTDRHSASSTGVSGSDPKLTAKVAALLGADVVDDDTEEA